MKKAFSLFTILLITTAVFAQTPTWSNDVASIIYNNCSTCHRDGGIGPFTLMSYDDAVFNSGGIKSQVQSKLMPPWKPDPNYTHFKDERILTQDQIDLLSAWVDGGTLSGDLLLAPPTPVFPVGSQMPVIDQTIQWPSWTVTTEIDEYRTFVYHSNYGEDVYLNQIEYLPGNGSIVHHMVLFYDEGSFTNTLDILDPLPGYESYGLGPISFSAVLLGAWAPGSGVFELPSNMGLKIPAGADIGLEIHYSPDSYGYVDSSQLNFKFTTEPNIREVYTDAPLEHFSAMTDGPLFIPANTIKTFHEKYKITGSDLSLISVFPHMHKVGSAINAFNVSSTGDTTKLIDIPKWSFHWQGFYNFQKLIHVKKSSTFWSEATYDNTTANPDNPSNPPEDVTAGEHTTQEMMITFFAYAEYQTGDENVILDSTLSSVPAITELNNLPMHIFPNPVFDEMYVGTELSKTSSVAFTLCDATGKTVREWNQTIQSGAQSNTFSLKGLSSGIYLLKAKTIDGNAIAKVIKQ